MCGRYTIRGLLGNMMDVLAPIKSSLDGTLWSPRFNVAPSQSAPVIRLNARGERVLGPVRWGLIPSWQKELPKVQPINAKSESVATSGMFRQAFQRRRCLVPADGFYEWRVVSPKVKQPYFFTADSGLFAFAGIWERWTAPGDDKPLDTFAILTTEANEVVKPVHARMPVMLDEAGAATWLEREADSDVLTELLHPFPADRMTAQAVSKHVNSPAHDDPSCVEPAPDM